jgi:hypothetical protein
MTPAQPKTAGGVSPIRASERCRSREAGAVEIAPDWASFDRRLYASPMSDFVGLVDRIATEDPIDAELVERALVLASESMVNAYHLAAAVYTLQSVHLGTPHARCARCVALEALVRRAEAMIIWHLEDGGTERKRL